MMMIGGNKDCDEDFIKQAPPWGSKYSLKGKLFPPTSESRADIDAAATFQAHVTL